MKRFAFNLAFFSVKGNFMLDFKKPYQFQNRCRIATRFSIAVLSDASSTHRRDDDDDDNGIA